MFSDDKELRIQIKESDSDSLEAHTTFYSFEKLIKCVYLSINSSIIAIK